MLNDLQYKFTTMYLYYEDFTKCTLLFSEYSGVLHNENPLFPMKGGGGIWSFRPEVSIYL